MKKSKVIESSSMSTCKRCGNTLVYREHAFLTKKQLNAPFYYEIWEFCKKCKAIYNHESDKVYNHNQKGRYFKAQKEFQDHQLSFFRTL